MKKLTNNVRIEGYLYQHKLEKRLTGANSKNPGTEYIRGSVDIATDESMTNIVTIYYSYVTPNASNTTVAEKYNVLNNIMNGVIPNAMTHGADKAAKVRSDCSVGLNEFYSTRNGEPELVSAKRLEDGFIRPVTELNVDESMRGRFDCDMLITGVTHVDADDERGLPEKAIVKGYVFGFRKDIRPVDFVSYGKGIGYFESFDASSKNPVFTRVKGNVVSSVVTRRIEEANAFGEPIVREVQNTRKEYVITWADPDGPYDVDDEVVEVVKNGKVALETSRAEAKQRAMTPRTGGALNGAAKQHITTTTSFDF